MREPGARGFGRRPVGESGGLDASAAPRKMQVGPLQTKSGCVDQDWDMARNYAVTGLTVRKYVAVR